MRIMIGVGHPKHVHIWKNVINNLVDDGHEVKIVARDKDITLHLLDAYGFDYVVVGKNYRNLAKKVYGIFETDFKLFKIVKGFKPDITVMGTPYLAHISKLLGIPHITLLDTEHAGIAYRLTYPFTDVICTPSCFGRKINSTKHVVFDGYFELAYLHPNYFTPDPSVLEDVGLSEDDQFIIIRFVAWAASHDIGDMGFSNKKEVVKVLEQYGKVFITSEIELPSELEKYRIKILPERIHHLIYYADLFIGESAPMSTESAILGTPAIFVSTSRRGYTDELESKYDLLYTLSDPRNAQEKSLEMAIELLKDKDAKKKWQKKRENLINKKIDVTKFMTEFIENYPESFHIQ